MGFRETGITGGLNGVMREAVGTSIFSGSKNTPFLGMKIPTSAIAPNSGLVRLDKSVDESKIRVIYLSKLGYFKQYVVDFMSSSSIRGAPYYMGTYIENAIKRKLDPTHPFVSEMKAMYKMVRVSEPIEYRGRYDQLYIRTTQMTREAGSSFKMTVPVKSRTNPNNAKWAPLTDITKKLRQVTHPKDLSSRPLLRTGKHIFEHITTKYWGDGGIGHAQSGLMARFENIAMMHELGATMTLTNKQIRWFAAKMSGGGFWSKLQAIKYMLKHKALTKKGLGRGGFQKVAGTSSKTIHIPERSFIRSTFVDITTGNAPLLKFFDAMIKSQINKAHNHKYIVRTYSAGTGPVPDMWQSYYKVRPEYK